MREKENRWLWRLGNLHKIKLGLKRKPHSELYN